MGFWKKIFPQKKTVESRTSSPLGKPDTLATKSNTLQSSGFAPPSNPVDPMKKVMWEVKKPRYAHMAKFHESRGDFSAAESHYHSLVEAYDQTLGSTHPDYATVLYELARLNHYHEVEHDPPTQVLYNSLGRGFQVFALYEAARNIRATSLGVKHPAYARSLYGLSVIEKDSRKTEEALAHITQALKIQSELDRTNSLGLGLSMLCLADVTLERGDLKGAISSYQRVLELLTLPSASLAAIEEARVYCEEAAKNLNDWEASRVPIENALALQRNPMLADPYFEMMFDLLGRQGGSLLLDALALHRRQYTGEYRTARVDTLKHLAAAYQKAGNPAGVIPLLEEAAEIQRNDG
jgi:tetratricopeptide (TPR) repeat protein